MNKLIKIKINTYKSKHYSLILSLDVAFGFVILVRPPLTVTMLPH